MHKKKLEHCYKRGLLTTLAWALGASASEEGPDYIGTKLMDDLSKAGYIVNNKIHNEFVRLSKRKYPENFSLDEEIRRYYLHCLMMYCANNQQPLFFFIFFSQIQLKCVWDPVS